MSSQLPPGVSPRIHRLARRFFRPVERFLRIEASSGILLLAAAATAVFWANSPWASAYHHLLHLELFVGFSQHTLRFSLHFLINEVLMVVFFFVVGLEIRREILEGELSSLRRAALPLAAALGGMAVPAIIYLMFNHGTTAAGGWGVPMATDIAFAVGVLTLLGSRVPHSLRMLLLALAIIDDVGAILVIALFYSGALSWIGLAVAGVGLAMTVVMQWSGIRNALAFFVPGAVVWAGLLQAGIHPTLAGVLLGLLTPARAWYGREGFAAEIRRASAELQRGKVTDVEQSLLITGVARACREAVAPAARIQAALHPWVAFVIMPLFALANAGVNISTGEGAFSGDGRLVWGISLGLLLGKPLGIVSFTWLAVRAGLTSLPTSVRWRGILVVGCVSGIGFTMSLFIGALAFSDSSRHAVAKLSILAASVAAAAIGLLIGRFALHPRKSRCCQTAAGEVER